MKILKKLAITVNSRVDAMADRFENREALSLAYINEYEKVVAKSKVKLAQIDSEVNRLSKEVAKMQESAELWADRARRVHASDEKKALECVSRMTATQKNKMLVEGDLQEARDLRNKMGQDLGYVLEKLKTLKRKHQNLSGRQVCADAVQAIQHVDGSIQHDIDNLFTRWETDVVANELHSHSPTITTDSFAEEFDSEEETKALQLALEEILTTPQNK